MFMINISSKNILSA